ncbi:85/88 kDa calcium-independent phospholipase A2-like [Dreissena polymorpha]|uniref:85/88 kDa calcium-independent phospholipase A2-like n=1 Tax=Dreissena polymorpha TaxID=45954 RepID=UPI0022649613|nr:85/88 kDa calcium-independent phospholipase A2-like [Dreissena polymorpha]
MNFDETQMKTIDMSSVSYKIIALIALGAMALGKDIRSGKNGPMSGGLFPIDSDDDKFEEIAQFAAKDIGSEFTLDSVEDAKAQLLDETAEDSNIQPQRSLNVSGWNMAEGGRILIMDGGGIRGLVMLEILEAIEKKAGQPIQQLFDWIGGTSTGGIIALGIATGKSVSHIRNIYYKLKDQVFTGSTPYDSEVLEKLLKEQFGETSVMTDIIHPKVLITGVLGDHRPWKLHMFRSYMKGYKQAEKGFYRIKPPNEQFIWETARSTSAAPSYFHPYNQFLDGGLMSNNPTLDILAEIHEFKKEQTKKADSGRSLDVVVSLGCGHVDHIPVTVPDLTSGGVGAIIPWLNFAKDVLYQVSISDGQPTNRASAWCEMMNVPFFRLSPLLTEDVPLNCVDKQKLEQMIQKTKSYIGEQMDSITKIAQYLKR